MFYDKSDLLLFYTTCDLVVEERSDISLVIVATLDALLGRHGSGEVLDLLGRQLSNLHVVDSDVILATSQDVEGILQLLGGVLILGDGDHVLEELLEVNSLTTIGDLVENGLEALVTSFEIELDDTKTRKARLELKTVELVVVVLVEVLEGFLELLPM